MRLKSPRLAVRAVIVEAGKLLLVNAWPDGKSDLLCAPGGGVEPHTSLPDNLKREVYEETGLAISVGALCLVNEFHDPDYDFHQVELFFLAQVQSGVLDYDWQDPEAVVTERRWVSADEIASLRVKPESLARVAFFPSPEVSYDALERVVR